MTNSAAQDSPQLGNPGPARIRPAEVTDVPQLLDLVRELAEYEKEPESATATVEQFTAALFGPSPAVFGFVIEEPNLASNLDPDADADVVDPAPRLAAMALWFKNFSTWTGEHGIYLEDLYVRPEFRGTGYGKALLARLAREAVDRGYTRFEWSVLDWNRPAIDFYRSVGAVGMDEWTVQRLDGAALRELATQSIP